MTTLTIIGIILLIIGFVLMGVEMAMPGFGAPGICGIVSLVAGIFCVAKTLEQGITITIIVIVLLAVMLTVILLMLQSKKAAGPVVLQDELKGIPEYIGEEDLSYLIGKEGIAITDLRPFGKGIFNGVELAVRALDGRYIDHDKQLVIMDVKENVLLVKTI